LVGYFFHSIPNGVHIRSTLPILKHFLYGFPEKLRSIVFSDEDLGRKIVKIEKTDEVIGIQPVAGTEGIGLFVGNFVKIHGVWDLPQDNGRRHGGAKIIP